jgi:putative aldouronate transport system substrate-binding protein
MPASWLVPLKAEDIPEFYEPVRSSVTRKKKHEKGENTMKKLISRRNFLKVCALAGSAAALSACGGKSTGGSNSAAAAVDVTGAVTFPLSEKVTFTGMTSFPVGSEPEPNNRTIFKRLEEQTNVHIDWTAIQSDQWSDKITLNMSNPNTLTDFVFTADFTDSNLLRYADQGVILNLEDYIDNNMPYRQISTLQIIPSQYT